MGLPLPGRISYFNYTPMNPRAFAAVLGLLLAPTLTVLAADKPSARPNPATPADVRNSKPADALYFVGCKESGGERRAFTRLITTTHPKHFVQYSAVDADADCNIEGPLLFGSRSDILQEIGHHTLVIVNNFRDTTLKCGNLSYEKSLKYWRDRFDAAQKVRPLKLVLLSTDKQPDPDMIALAEHTGGSYRKLKRNADGNYE